MSALGASLAQSDVAAVLRDPAYLALERNIAEAVGQPLISDYLDFVLPLVTNDLNEARLTMAEVAQLLAMPLENSTAFGIALIRGEGAMPDEQEWNPAEGNQQVDTHKGNPVGLSPGFGLLALVYLHFLNARRDEDLLSLLKRRRVPNAKGFLGRLKSYHQGVPPNKSLERTREG